MEEPLEIKSKKQENGLWGMPMQCRSLDRAVYVSDELWKLNSAILIGIAEVYPDYTFEVWGSSEKGFMITLRGDGRNVILKGCGNHSDLKSDKKSFSIKYENYKLKGNKLYYGKNI